MDEEIFKIVDSCFSKGQFELVDLGLKCLTVVDMPTDVILALLTITLPARSNLPSRKAFYFLAVEELTKRDEIDLLEE